MKDTMRSLGLPLDEGQSSVFGSGRSTPFLFSRRSGRSPRMVGLLLALMAALSISGCGVNVTDKTPAQPTPLARNYTGIVDAPNTVETHDLAVSAVDFDPALDAQQIILGKPYSLLVAIENKGNRKEEQVVVSAQLLTQDRQQVLMSSQKTVNLLAAGDLTLVRFPGATNNLPRQRVYLLNVQVQPTTQESNTSNNKRTLEIQVN